MSSLFKTMGEGTLSSVSSFTCVTNLTENSKWSQMKRIPLLLLACLAACGWNDPGRIGPMLSNCNAAWITLHVQNNSSYDLKLSTSQLRIPQRPLAYRETEIKVGRGLMRAGEYLRIEATRGGGFTDNPVYVYIEHVDCRDATLVIPGNINHSVFYGDFPFSGLGHEK